MDIRISDYLEKVLEVPFAEFPTEGILVHACDSYRFQLVRIGNGAVLSGRREVVDLLKPTIDDLTMWELFSPFGLAELRRTAKPYGFEPQSGSFHYTLTAGGRAREPLSRKPTTCLLPLDYRPDPDRFDKEFSPAFSVEIDGKCVSTAGIRWKSESFAEIEVETDENHRGRGYALAVVGAATQCILDRNAAAHYAVHPTNTPSMRIVRKLGYRLTWQEMYAD